MKDYIQISIHPVNQEQSEILVAQLSEMGFEGFEEQEKGLNAFIEKDQLEEGTLTQIISLHQLEYTRQLIPAQNWNQIWEKNFQPISVDDFCGIRAAFHPHMNGVQYDIIITPKMSFGTGHHVTTYLMIQAMRRVELQGKRVLDFGTGTGLLAILAEKMGAAHVLAIDHDEWSIQNARENLVCNDCLAVTIKKKDSLEDIGVFDLILANINKSVIINSLKNLSQHLKQDGVVLLSGLLSEDLQEIQQELVSCPLSISLCVEQKNWICLRLQHG
ncbi:MAG TPA: 50S ribosomal protein L11 methyltransferase [Puia sp.]|nr:50S ribosomal protein L11 methyltransferase [Puia sp.]